MKINKDDTVKLIKAARAARDFLLTLINLNPEVTAERWLKAGDVLAKLEEELSSFSDDLYLTDTEWDRLGDE